MKNQLIIFILFSITTTICVAQKKIIGTPIEGTNLFISAEAYTVSNVKFKIKKNVNESLEEIPEFTLNPFTKYSFNVEMNSIFKKLRDSASVSELKKKGVDIKKELKEILDNTVKLNEGSPLYYKDQTKLSNQIDYLYNYFNTQLVLIFKYDNEPIAGRLQYNTDIKRIQYFPNNNYELYFRNRTKNYLDLIKKLYLERSNHILDEKNILIESKICGQMDFLLEEDTDNQPNLLIRYKEVILEHFAKKTKEYNSEYLSSPELFFCHYAEIINNFSSYNRKKRMQLIKEQLLKLENEKIYNTMEYFIDGYEYNSFRFNKEKDILKGYVEIQKLLIDNDSLIKYRDSRSEKSIQFAENMLTLQQNVRYFDAIKENYIEDFKYQILQYDELSDHKITIQIVPDSIAANYPRLKFLKQKHDQLVGEIKSQEEQLAILKKEKLDNAENIINIKIEKNKRRIESLEKDLFYRYGEKTVDKTDTYNLSQIKKRIEFLTKDVENIENDLKRLKNSILTELEKAPLWEFKADDIQLDINDGFVEHIVVLGVITIPTTNNGRYKEFNNIVDKIIEDNPDRNINNGKRLKFVNQFPYGFSSTKDFDDFKEYKLYVYNGKHKQFEMRLGDLFPNYIQTLQNDRLDFSPKNQVVNLPVDSDTEGSVELKKDKSSKLFSLSAYSDFNGLKETDPNGVIQFEINKLIPLYTKRRTSFVAERSITRGYNYGYLNYIRPQFRWSRLSDNNDEKNLTLSYLSVFNGVATDSLRYVTQLDLLRYENISIGADLNILSFDFPSSKIRVEINASGRYARTRVLDTKGRPVNGQNSNNETVSNIVQTYNLNTWRFYPEFILRLRPEERYGANLALRPIRFNTVTDGFSNISSEEVFTTNLSDDKQWLHQVEINAHFSPSGRKDDRFFFRYRYTNTSSWEYNGFSEIQVGYSMSLKF